MPHADLQSRLAAVKDRLARAAVEAGRDPQAVRLVAVTKTVEPDRIREASGLGVRHVGEGRVQEALRKQELLADLPLDWHLIGHLQTNKVRQAVGRFTLIHSVDSVKLLEAIDTRARELGLRQAILLQVNVAQEASKFGFRPDDVPEALQGALRLQGISVRGFMTIAPKAEALETVRPVFRRLRELKAACERLTGQHLAELSMGMSADYPVAIAEGATLVRIGTELFGERPGHPPGLDEEA